MMAARVVSQRSGACATSTATPLLACAMLVAAACGGSSSATRPDAEGGTQGGATPRSGGTQAVTVEAQNRWKDAVAAFKAAQHEGWNEQRCDSVSAKFEAAAATQSRFPEALYMAGVAQNNCGREQKAIAYFRKALQQNPKFCKARVATALDEVRRNSSAGLQELDAAVREDPQCTEGYVNLAILQRKNGDLKGALNNLRRALAIDAQYLPAFNEMALLYLQQAQDNKKMLDLAEVVCSQAQKIDVNFAPIYNTWGLIDLRRKEIISAAAKFQRAFELDPKMFEAYMNFAQITIGFRGYEDARNAFSKALELQPKSFDATVGLGVAYRGLEQKDKAEEFYNKARDLDPKRPEPYYNLGLLYQDFKDSSADQVKKARAFYEQFLGRAGGQERYRLIVDDIKRRCKVVKGQRRAADKCIAGRFQNIEDYLRALKDMEEMERLQKESERQQAELEAQEKKAAEQNPPAQPPPAPGQAAPPATPPPAPK
jgi:tetratricopeptide (TPR) repeat protein